VDDYIREEACGYVEPPSIHGEWLMYLLRKTRRTQSDLEVHSDVPFEAYNAPYRVRIVGIPRV